MEGGKEMKTWKIVLSAIVVAVIVGTIIEALGHDAVAFVNLCMVTLAAYGILWIIGDPGENPIAGAVIILFVIGIVISWAMMIFAALQEIGWGVVMIIIILGILGFVGFLKFKNSNP